MGGNSHQGRLSKKTTSRKTQLGEEKLTSGQMVKKSDQDKISKVEENSRQGLPLSLVEELLESFLELIAVGRRSS